LESIAHRAARFSRLITAQPQFRRVPVWLFGNSLGCATAAYVASLGEVPVAGIILRNPPPLEATVKRVARRYPFGQWADPIAESLPPEMNLLRTAPRVRAPTVFLQSEHDRLVPPELQRQVHEALAGTKRLVVLRGLGHDGPIGEEHEDEVAAAVTWLWQRSAATARPTASESRAPLQSGEA
jgi:pimeloyl-ACP methyl ester carboxylesterase